MSLYKNNDKLKEQDSTISLLGGVFNNTVKPLALNASGGIDASITAISNVSLDSASSNYNGTPTASSSVVSVSTSVVTLLSSNSARRGFTIYNISFNTLYVKLGSSASTSDFSFIVPANSGIEFDFPCYTGIITAIRSSGTDNVYISSIGV